MEYSYNKNPACWAVSTSTHAEIVCTTAVANVHWAFPRTIPVTPPEPTRASNRDDLLWLAAIVGAL